MASSQQHPVIDSGVVEDLKGKTNETTPQQTQSQSEPSINTQSSTSGDQKLPPTHASEISSPPIVTPSAAGQAPDPDEDDLDDLDDMLDEFTSTKISPPTDQPSAKPTTTLPADTITDKVTEKVASEDGPTLKEDDFAAEFNAQLQKEMAALMSSVDENPETKKQFETMLSQLGLANDEAMASTSSSSSSKPKAAPPSTQGTKSNEDAFQDTIRRTMERMQASGQSADAAAAGDEDFLAQMLKEMNAEGGEEDFSKMLLSMMEQLTNKEILYEPMKELHDKFPAWIAANEDKTSKEDMGRYKEQKRLVGEIVACFEKKGYSDDRTQDREYIVERMQLMQAQGSPPAELVGDMGDPSAALGGMAGAMDGCPQQ